MKKHAIGVLIKDRWDFTFRTLKSINDCEQSSDSFDLFVLDNGSTNDNIVNLEDYLRASHLHWMRLDLLQDLPISIAWNKFLYMAKDYEYKTKIDNDIVVPNVKFLDIMAEYSRQANVDLVSAIPVNPGLPPHYAQIGVSRAVYNNMPYLYGACMMLTKKCFETLGYFDERLERQVDVEYSQRAILNNLNIGYPTDFYVDHLGLRGSTTMSKEESQRKYKEASHILKDEGRMVYAPTLWENQEMPIENSGSL